MLDQTTYADTHSVTFSPASRSGHKRFDAKDEQMIDLFGLFLSVPTFQPAGAGAEVTDERHLWPAWLYFISEHIKRCGKPLPKNRVAVMNKL